MAGLVEVLVTSVIADMVIIGQTMVRVNSLVAGQLHIEVEDHPRDRKHCCEEEDLDQDDDADKRKCTQNQSSVR